MRIGTVDTDEKVFVIAEVGNNHEGDVELAKNMVAKAAASGADAVKFQTFQAEHFCSKLDAKRFNTLKRFELTQDEFVQLKQEADNCGILFISTPLDLPSVHFLSELVVSFKVASGDNTFYPLLLTMATYDKPIILSCGLADLTELRYAMALVKRAWRDNGYCQDLAALHCVTSYPVPLKDANLALVSALARQLDCVTGYSDHTMGMEACVLAVAAGARIVEKHFTIDKNYSDFRDHQLSADPTDMKDLVERIRQTEILMGSGEKVLQNCERDLVRPVRRSLTAVRDMRTGEVVTMRDIGWLRPGGGLAPGRENEILGRVLVKDVTAGTQFTLKDVEA